ncbi:unnamed protein product [Allacma fusca]|uniref:tRNA (Uracil-5-)-methyltransferase homolog A n=1 Tax=Allacma fusca TaxID=39272 RepID=A0A8J2L9V1_9HEXA|nr:unnamed protein product [Allacma fusca]
MEGQNIASVEEGLEVDPGQRVKTEDEPMESIKPEESEPEATKDNNPYAYLQRDEFCSERYKIELRNLPKQYGFNELKKFMMKLKLNPHKIKKGTAKGHFVFISFRTEEERDKARATLSGQKWKNKVLEASFANAAKDPLVKQRASLEGKGNEEPEEIFTESVDEMVKKSTTPWFDVPYSEQLEKKNEIVRGYLEGLKKELFRTNMDLRKLPNPLWVSESILPSPVTSHYRNKCEFTIGYNPENKEKTVGFRLSSYKRGSKAVGKIDSLIHLPEKMVQGAQVFETFIRKSSYEPYDPETHVGVWKQLTVRTSSTDLLLMLIISRKDLSQHEVEILKKDLRLEFKDLKSPAISSFFIKELEVQGQKTKNEPELLFGKGYNAEKICNLSFRISAESFFQINSLAAEVLINAIKSHAELDDDTCLLDICCGTGTLGLCLGKFCGEVHGVELISSAVEDARVNAKDNGLEDKCQFYCGKAEDVVDVLTYQTKKKKIVAIVDPPRAGVQLKVLQTLRRCSKIDTVVYVSCDAEAAKKNFVDLARPESKKYRLNPFVPRRFIPVDLFPMSPHMELIVILQRIQDESCNTIPLC